MDLTKAQRLLAKIQAFLDPGNSNELSRLEKDLMKTYILQLYETVTSEEVIHSPENSKQADMPADKKYLKDNPPVYIPETPRTEPVKPVYTETIVSMPQEVSKEIKVPDPEPVIVKQKPEPKPIQIPITEPGRETLHSSHATLNPQDVSEAIDKLFELPKTEEIAGRFGHIPIQSIEAAMGLNERIFTLNELFGGDKGLFDITCAELNTLTSFSEAKKLLLNGPAKHFNWSDPERVKMAEQFIRIVARRYPIS